MTSIATYEHYKILGVNVGAGFADITASYKRLCRVHHPDVSGDPSSVELMKDINVAYMALRDKFIRETALRNKHSYARPVRASRYSNPDIDTSGQGGQKTESKSSETDTSAEIGASSVINDYFTAINNRDYIKAYKYLSSYDKAHITQECFVEWRQSVARLYPMREFTITGGLMPTIVKFKDNKTLSARKFNVTVTEGNYADDSTHKGVIEKLVTKEHGSWKVFLGYKSVIELTRRFEERLEAKRKRDIDKRWEEFCTELCSEYDMYNIAGIRKIAKREIYRQRRYGGTFSLAAISVMSDGSKFNGYEEMLSSAARTISSSLRQTDVSAYVGDGVFVLLFIELKKRSSHDVLARLVEKIRQRAGAGLGLNATIKYSVDTWTSGNKADMDAINAILAKFKKTM